MNEKLKIFDYDVDDQLRSIDQDISLSASKVDIEEIWSKKSSSGNYGKKFYKSRISPNQIDRER